ncbi:MAG: glycosyltransferase [Chitinophagaceae bacterium]
MQPLVSIICLCYNQSKYVKEALLSVLNQTYRNIELIVVDDASIDGSVNEILKLVKNHPEIQFFALQNNNGNCKAFNFALDKAKGEYIIDLAADDVLLPERVALGVAAFQNNDSKYGVNFSDAEYIDGDSKFIRNHYEREKDGNLKSKVPVDDVYKEMLSRYFICPPTFMARKEVFNQLGGYDESLTYEDFDFFVRSSRRFKFCYTDKVLVQKRVLPTSLSTKQYLPGSPQLLSTYYICEKAYILNKTKEEHLALKKRIRFELKQALISKNYSVAKKFLELYNLYPEGKSYIFLFLVNMLVLFKPNLPLISGFKLKSNLQLSK